LDFVHWRQAARMDIMRAVRYIPVDIAQPEKTMQAAPIEGEKLTTWRVLRGGAQICFDFVAIDGGTHRIVLPFDVLSGLMMTLPHMLQTALD
jgi:hypothetical protein